MIQEEKGIVCMPYSSKIINEVLPENHKMQKFDFLKPTIHFNNLILCLKWEIEHGLCACTER